MALRVFLITIILGLVFAFFTNYIFSNFTPFDLDKLQEIAKEKGIEEEDFNSLNEEIDLLIKENKVLEYATNNLYLGGLAFTITIFFFFLSLHIAVDKFFFKKFFEKPLYFVGVRRGILFSLTSILIIYLNLNGVDKLTLAGVVLLSFIIELVLNASFKNKDKLNSQLDSKVELK